MRKALSYGFRYIKRFPALYTCSLLLSLAIGLFGVVVPWVLAQIVDYISGKQAAASLVELVLIYLAFAVARMLIGYLSSHLNMKLQTEMGYQANIEVLKGLYRTSYCNIGREDPAALNQMINNDCNEIMIFTLSFLRDILTNCTVVGFILWIIANQSLLLAAAFLVLVFFYAMLYFAYHKKLYAHASDVRSRQTDFFGKLYDVVANLKSIKLNGFTERIMQRQDASLDRYYVALKKQLIVSNSYGFCSEAVSMAAQVILFLYGGGKVLAGEMSLGIFVIVSNYFSTMISSASFFLNFGSRVQAVKACYDRLSRYLQVPQSRQGSKRVDKVERIDLKRVSFSYPDTDALFQVEKSLAAGKTYWIKGENGKGKTTFLHLIGGLFETEYGGEVEVNGIPASDLNYVDFIQEHVGIVEQRPYLLSETFQENILCKFNGKTGDMTKEKEEKVLRALGLWDMLERLPQGLDTEFNILMDNLSGGERQKLALARLFLSETEVWILDEPTAALDEESKRGFYELLQEGKKGRIVLLISHETVPEYDEILAF